VGLLEISRVLEETARLVRQHAGQTEEPPRKSSTGPTADRVAASQVRAILKLRRMRRRYLGLEASDAAWTMILEAYAARLEGRCLHQRALASAAKLPETTALRATRRLLAAGIFHGHGDPEDRRLLVIRLADDAAERLGAYLAVAGARTGYAA
jgi:DNA-binding MarR family transcriptional regulator